MAISPPRIASVKSGSLPLTQANSCIFYIMLAFTVLILHYRFLPLRSRNQQIRCCWSRWWTSFLIHYQPQNPLWRKRLTRNNPQIMLPAVAKLMPPLLLYHLAFIDLVDSPKVTVTFVEKDALKDMTVVWNRSSLGIMIHPKLMLVVGTIERHLNLLWVLCVWLRIIHGSITARLVICSPLLALGKSNLVCLRFRAWLCTQGSFELSFIVLLEVLAIGMRDCYIIIELCASKDESLFGACCSPQNLESIISQN